MSDVRETIIGSIVAVDFSGEKVLVSIEVDRHGPWRREMCAIILLGTSTDAGRAALQEKHQHP